MAFWESPPRPPEEPQQKDKISLMNSRLGSSKSRLEIMEALDYFVEDRGGTRGRRLGGWTLLYFEPRRGAGQRSGLECLSRCLNNFRTDEDITAQALRLLLDVVRLITYKLVEYCQFTFFEHVVYALKAFPANRTIEDHGYLIIQELIERGWIEKIGLIAPCCIHLANIVT